MRIQPNMMMPTCREKVEWRERESESKRERERERERER